MSRIKRSALAMFCILPLTGFIGAEFPADSAQGATYNISEGATEPSSFATLEAILTRVRETYPDAKLMEIQGSHPLTEASQTTIGFSKWRYVFQGDVRTVVFAEKDVDLPSIELTTTTGRWLEDRSLSTPMTMGFEEAFSLLKKNYDATPQSVVSRHPLYPFGNPLFIFNVASHFVSVDSVTGEVQSLSND